jgi:hypothetical protein
MLRAIEMSVYVVRAFVQLHEMLASNRELARRTGGGATSAVAISAARDRPL